MRRRRRRTFEQLEPRRMLAIGPPVSDPVSTFELSDFDIVHYEGAVVTGEFSYSSPVGPVNVVVEALTADYTVNEDEVLVVDAANGVSGGLLGVTLVAGPAHGLLMLDDDGSFILAPDEDWFGVDQFIHSRDGIFGLTTVLVLNVNDAPTAVDDLIQAVEDIPQAFDVLANDTDPDGNTLAVESFTQPPNGAVVYDGNGIFTYTPNPDYNGTDTFEYIATDSNEGTDTATVTITVAAVNDPPVAVPESYSVRVNAALSANSAAGVVANDYDVDGDGLSAIVVTTPPAHGRLTISAENGSFLYIPDPGFVGEDSYEYTVSDGLLTSDPATVTITIVDSSLPIVRSEVYLSGPGGIIIDAATGVLANDIPVGGAGAGLVATLVTAPSHGDMAMAADGSFTYTPDVGFVGADAFTYRATDGLLFEEVQSAIWVEATMNDVPPPRVSKQQGSKVEDSLPRALGGGSIWDTMLFGQIEAQKRAWLDGPILPAGVDAVIQGV